MDKLWTAEQTATNGVKKLLDEIRRVQPDMPPECRDDLNFGALVVIHELGVERSRKIRRIERVQGGLIGFMGLLWLTVVALHGDIPWLTALFHAIFGV